LTRTAPWQAHVSAGQLPLAGTADPDAVLERHRPDRPLASGSSAATAAASGPSTSAAPLHVSPTSAPAGARRPVPVLSAAGLHGPARVRPVSVPGIDGVLEDSHPRFALHGQYLVFIRLRDPVLPPLV